MSIQSKILTITRKASDFSISIYIPINVDHNKHHEIAQVGLTMYNRVTGKFGPGKFGPSEFGSKNKC